MESSSYTKPEKAETWVFESQESVNWITQLILNGEAVPEIGKTPKGRFLWLKIHKVNRETNEKTERLFYTEYGNDVRLFYDIFNRRGIEPEFQVIEDKKP
ncbi:MAG: hypothetical protein UW79_C0036G0002 [Candidatus Yanofskybacteria bacterium GW2011_GWA2_44_9]|uniref:Uncharacterized protein n=1 Tax=Candidatus Yanofskybacteria bacterium GW2011_GWA2_44_9 TaxID=1619025 RepID=A0A0G1N951_9BACT|nr:MAG: hypothetical protein UW79_C0036G0002 [Candidatus Yanofskybacteria bacterium GW2011_GWA2_44_9]